MWGTGSLAVWGRLQCGVLAPDSPTILPSFIVDPAERTRFLSTMKRTRTSSILNLIFPHVLHGMARVGTPRSPASILTFGRVNITTETMCQLTYSVQIACRCGTFPTQLIGGRPQKGSTTTGGLLARMTNRIARPILTSAASCFASAGAFGNSSSSMPYWVKGS